MTTPGKEASNDDLTFPDLLMPSRAEHIAANFVVLQAVDRVQRRRAAHNQDPNVEREQKRLALETAVLVQEEVAHWEASIRELEALLQQQQQQSTGKDQGDTEASRETTLPVVVDEEDDSAISSTAFGISTPSTSVDNVRSP